MSSWIDGVLEYTILKHEVVVLRLKNKRVLDRIQEVSKQWPKKKEFIEGDFKTRAKHYKYTLISFAIFCISCFNKYAIFS